MVLPHKTIIQIEPATNKTSAYPNNWVQSGFCRKQKSHPYGWLFHI